MTETAGAQEIPTAAKPAAPLRYEPQEIEARWMQRWLEDGCFHAEIDDSRPSYSIVVPPPNITGVLHMGHALNGSVQDVLARYQRMRGKNVLWMPGTDHAGIATQNVVEKQLRSEGKTRHDLGREQFVERVREWRKEYGSTIISQFQRIGCSLDYARERFTMDEPYAAAVTKTFVHLYDKGYIYRDNYLVNWCGQCGTAISDLEVRQVEMHDEMFEIAYPLVDGSGELVVATVRPETIVADVAVAVHPDDPRYKALVGTTVRVPLSGREVPIIADEYVDPAFGTGALKITPGHDPNDFAIGTRHGLPRLSAIEPDLSMSALAGEFAGLTIDEARIAMVGRIDELGLLRGREPYTHSVPHCDRSGTRIEPLISRQWFCNMAELAKPAIEMVASGDVRFVPAGAANIFHTWMEDLQPWCLSRQLWWGHQLPVWYCDGDAHHVHVSADGPHGACPECGAASWSRDPDVLDTWFSSGLWSFATMGWPQDTPELRHFHPTAVLCTAREIINLWVARMMMLSFELLGEKPFSDVYIHSVVQAADGRRMSKSLGTGVDPLEVIAQYGADATRYGLLTMSSTQDVRFNAGKIKEGRDLANKLWNASRLLATQGDISVLGAWDAPLTLPEGGTLAIADSWLLARLEQRVGELAAHIEQYEFAAYVKGIYAFVWGELCDWYLEAVKHRMRSEDAGERATATRVLAYALSVTLRLVHPAMPHITEEIARTVWGGDGPFVLRSQWPDVAQETAAAPANSAHVGVFSHVQSVVGLVRSLRAAAGVGPVVPITAALRPANGDAGAALTTGADLLAHLGHLSWVDDAPAGGVDLPVRGGTISLFGLDEQALAKRLEDELVKTKREIKRATGKLADERFVSRAPEDLVAAERAKLAAHEQTGQRLANVLRSLAS